MARCQRARAAGCRLPYNPIFFWDCNCFEGQNRKADVDKCIFAQARDWEYIQSSGGNDDEAEFVQ